MNRTREGMTSQKIWLASSAMSPGEEPSALSQTKASKEVSGKDAINAANPVERLAISEIATMSKAEITTLSA